MNQLLRVDSYALARADGTEWRTEWCVAHHDAAGDWQFGKEAGELLRPKRSADENSEYLEAPNTAENRNTSDLDLTYLQLRQFLPKGEEPIDLSVSGGIDQPQLEGLLGILETLGYTPRSVFPTALMAARGLAPGRYGMIELGRNHSWISTVDVQPDQVRLESVREYGNFGFYQIFTQWMENVAEAFAAQHRFDMHRNLAANREQLFGQMRKAFADQPRQMQFSLDSRLVTLDEEMFQTRWPKPAFDTEGLELRLLPPLTQALPLPERRLGLPCCANPDPQAYSGLAATLPEDGRAHRCVALSL